MPTLRPSQSAEDALGEKHRNPVDDDIAGFLNNSASAQSHNTGARGRIGCAPCVPSTRGLSPSMRRLVTKMSRRRHIDAAGTLLVSIRPLGGAVKPCSGAFVRRDYGRINWIRPSRSLMPSGPKNAPTTFVGVERFMNPPRR